MSNYETIYLLEHSIEQINALRRTVEELEPRAHAYDTITQILALRDDGRRNHCAQVDLVWELKEKVARLRAEAEAERVPADWPATRLCDCDCGTKCPLGKTGSEQRCTVFVGTSDLDAEVDAVIAAEDQPARPLRTHRECACPEGPCRHDALDQFATSATRPIDGSDGDE